MQIIVVDTNVLLHFHRLDDSRWAAHFDAPCRFVIPAMVIKELDRHKLSETLRLQKRARELLPWLEKHDGQSIGRGHELALRSTEPHRTLARIPELDGSHPDDRIIATALEIRDAEPDAEVVLLSADTGPRLKARHHQITALCPSEELRLAPTRTREEQERDAAVKRLQDFEKRSAHLELEAQGGIRTLALGPRDQQDPEVRLREAVELERIALGSSCTEDYIADYTNYVRSAFDLLALASHCVSVHLQVRNTGTHHAEHVCIEVEWSSPPRFLECFPECPQPPDKPNIWAGIAPLRRDFHRFPFADIASRDMPSGPNGVPGESRVVYRIPRLVHGISAELDALLLQFDSLDSARGFSLRWKIHAAHQAEATRGELHFQVSADRSLDEVVRLVGFDHDDRDPGKPPRG